MGNPGRDHEERLAGPTPSGRAGAAGEGRLVAWLGGPLLLGALLGLLLPTTGPAEPEPWQRLSEVIGWAYFCAWSVSFYPQVVQNFRRRSVVGLSLDYQLLNLAGFACYFAFNAALYWDPVVRREYREAHGGESSAVRLNDVFFAGHALAITAVTLLQIGAFYDYPALDKPDRLLRYAVAVGLAVLLVGSAGAAATLWATSERPATWLSYLSLLSEVKVAISVVKYCPQVWLNHRRKCTDGWNIVNVLLDFSGGLLSVAQLVMDALATRDWGAVTGDPAKFLLGNLSMFFDVIFMVQHYCLYSGRAPLRTSAGP